MWGGTLGGSGSCLEYPYVIRADTYHGYFCRRQVSDKHPSSHACFKKPCNSARQCCGEVLREAIKIDTSILRHSEILAQGASNPWSLRLIGVMYYPSDRCNTLYSCSLLLDRLWSWTCLDVNSTNNDIKTYALWCLLFHVCNFLFGGK